MTEQTRLVLEWIDYGEYVTAWSLIPIERRPKVQIQRINGEYVAKDA